jgi:E3 ubiquitin-protein ligase mind-bomb
MHDILDEEKSCFYFFDLYSQIVLFPALTAGMRVQRGPDWQWAEQDGGIGHQGTILTVKEWKGVPKAAVRIRWDVGMTENTYRYGGENCYDVVLY